ncbi:hypothetical protein C8N24_4587 [Solirubrobacter pauli]|uniref:Uncharacterized protein n=1 Tax=Solirubrobacter pauli TaxID=166793 RepID=A0A660L032_9ACTN|nr:hypothetical protein [Solirubrobacter pauli]RKQ86574.1 hypothetical protein C8N24_4587 [Solirubrobacter pauli]
MNELEWLKEAQPAVPEPDTATARAALLAHMAARPEETAKPGHAAPGRELDSAAPGRAFADAAPGRPAAADDDAYAALRRRAAAELGDTAPRASRPRRPRLGRRERRAEAARARRAAWRPRLAFASAAVLVAATLAVAWPNTDAPNERFAAPVTPAPVVEAPLVRLSQEIAQEPDPKGDATLVIRTQRYPDDDPVPGYDLYLDDGRYYYGSTKEELKVSGLTSDSFQGPLMEAAIKATDLPADKARREMDLALSPNAPKVSRSVESNHVWTASMDALLAGAGRKDVRAGVMRLLATIDTLKTREEGKLLKLTSTDFPDGYAESLYIDAETGIPQKFEGGVPGKEPDVRIDYDVKRVTAANWADAAAKAADDQAPAADAPRRTDQAPPARRP